MSRNNRNLPVISRQSDESISEDHWLKQFQKSLLKDAVQPKAQESLFDQINTIMNGKSKYTSVDSAVKDMQERSGLTAYLNKISETAAEKPSAKKVVASDNQEAIDKKVPMVFRKHPAIKTTLENYIKSTRGNLPVPAIIDKLRSIHQNDVSDAQDWEDPKLLIEVSGQNLKEKSNNPDNFTNYNHLGNHDSDSAGDIDASNTDAFLSLTPAKI